MKLRKCCATERGQGKHAEGCQHGPRRKTLTGRLVSRRSRDGKWTTEVQYDKRNF